MLERKTERFELKSLKILDENGNCDETLMPKLGSKSMRQLFELMIRLQMFDEKAKELQNQGIISACFQSRGREALKVGSAFPVRPDDWVVPFKRDGGSLFVAGMPAELIYLYWALDERGLTSPQKQMSNYICFSDSAVQAAGIAFALKTKNKKAAVLCKLSGKHAGTGEFHEAMEMASNMGLPIVFFLESTHCPNTAKKAFAHGVNYIHVDGEDVFAVYKATKEALDMARGSLRPTVIECVLGNGDPVKRYRLFLLRKGVWDAQYESRVRRIARQKLEEAVLKIENKKASIEDMFSHTYYRATPRLKEQMLDLAR